MGSTREDKQEGEGLTPLHLLCTSRRDSKAGKKQPRGHLPSSSCLLCLVPVPLVL